MTWVDGLNQGGQAFFHQVAILSNLIKSIKAFIIVRVRYYWIFSQAL